MANRPVSVRVTQDVLRRLDARVAELGKPDRSSHIRDLIINDLMTADEAESENPAMAEVRQEIRALRNTLATAVVGLLVSMGTPQSPEEAEEWVRENLASRPPK